MDILPLVLDGRTDQLYVEPFVGGANSFHLVDNPKWGNDINPDLIAMWQAVTQGWVPPGDVSEGDYTQARNGSAEPHVRGFIGFGASFGGKFFGGYARDRAGVNYAAQSQRSVMRQASGLTGAAWTTGPYWVMDIPDGSYVYCDPPYAATTGYREGFDSAKFWEWAEALAQRCTVFVSEYAAPPGWVCVWQAETRVGVNHNQDKQAVERLFTRQ